MNSRKILRICSRLFSLLVVIFILGSIFLVHAGRAGGSYALLALLTLAIAVTLRYVAIYHRFSKTTYRTLALGPLIIALGISGAASVEVLLSTASLEEFWYISQHGALHVRVRGFFQKWRIAILLVFAGSLILAGSFVTEDLSPYPKPNEIREIAISPVYFSTVCTFFGLWAVLFVGIAIQRVVIIAPIFEELLKFGVALLVGSTLFGRSLVARIGVAVVVGSLFGIVEHATTYPEEAGEVYLFRTVFHMVTTVLSVSVYTLFELRGENRLRWIAPVYPIMLHFFYNTFVVLSSVISVLVFGSVSDTVSLIYGTAVILLATVLLVVAIISEKALVGMHVPLEYVLSDLV